LVRKVLVLNISRESLFEGREEVKSLILDPAIGQAIAGRPSLTVQQRFCNLFCFRNAGERK